MNNNKRQPCEIFSRAMGFYRPISFFNKGKRAEFEERNTFKESIIFKHLANLFKSKKED